MKNYEAYKAVRSASTLPQQSSHLSRCSSTSGIAALASNPESPTSAKLSNTFFLKNQEIQRADERTRTAYPCNALQGCAGDCKCSIFRGVSFLRVAACCTVLRSRWYQIGINRGLASSQYCSIAHASEVRPAPRRHMSIKLTLDHYSHWMPS